MIHQRQKLGLALHQLWWMSGDLGVASSDRSCAVYHGIRICWSVRITSDRHRHDEPSFKMKSFGIPIIKTTPMVFCRMFEDNAGAIHLAKIPKMRPRTRHINQKYHHFREWVKSWLIDILPIDTLDQSGDLMTKPLNVALFVKHRFAIMGW